MQPGARFVCAGYWTGILGTLALLVPLWLIGCTTPASKESLPSGENLIGKSRQQLLFCAGSPLREINLGTETVLRYYKEAPMLEESFMGSKGSKAGIHHGCWASVMLSDDRVSGVEYKPVPDSLQATHDCEEIFQSCLQ